MLGANVSQKLLGIRAPSLPPRRVRPVAALAAGVFAGGIALFLLQFIGIVVYDESPWKLMRMVAAMVRGPGVLDPDDEFDLVLAAISLALFFSLSMLYALALSRVVADLPRPYAPAIGLAFGTALYYANFYGFTAIFPWFAALRTADTLVVHLVFGLAVARVYWALRRPAMNAAFGVPARRHP